jgi:GTP 3',8-cyclase
LSGSQLIDQYQRHLNYLRISITDRCNLHCIYCMPRDLIHKLSHEEVLSYEEILRLVRIAKGLNISKVRVTGGEPLVRKGVYDFLDRLVKIDGIDDVSLTTNGVFLGENLERIWSAGIRRINVSLDTLKRDRFREITGRDKFQSVWKGIHAALDKGFAPIKINMVPLRGINEDELIAFAELSLSYPFHIRFIEQMPVGNSAAKIDRPLLTPEIRHCISRLGRLEPVVQAGIAGPAERFRFEGGKGEIGFISALSNHFCHRCNRLRLTASGQLRPCLLSDKQEDVRGPLREGASDREIEAIFLKAVESKPSRHCLSGSRSGGVSTQMSSIGG